MVSRVIQLQSMFYLFMLISFLSLFPINGLKSQTEILNETNFEKNYTCKISVDLNYTVASGVEAKLNRIFTYKEKSLSEAEIKKSNIKVAITNKGIKIIPADFCGLSKNVNKDILIYLPKDTSIYFPISKDFWNQTNLTFMFDFVFYNKNKMIKKATSSTVSLTVEEHHKSKKTSKGDTSKVGSNNVDTANGSGGKAKVDDIIHSLQHLASQCGALYKELIDADIDEDNPDEALTPFTTKLENYKTEFLRKSGIPDVAIDKRTDTICTRFNTNYDKVESKIKSMSAAAGGAQKDKKEETKSDTANYSKSVKASGEDKGSGVSTAIMIGLITIIAMILIAGIMYVISKKKDEKKLEAKRQQANAEVEKQRAQVQKPIANKNVVPNQNVIPNQNVVPNQNVIPNQNILPKKILKI